MISTIDRAERPKEPKMSENKQSISTGLGFGGALFLLFLGLKLGKVIDWSWWYVTMPLWIPLAIVLTIFAGISLFALLAIIFLAATKKN